MKYLALLLIPIMLVTGCIQPEVKDVRLYWGDVTQEYTELKADVALSSVFPFLPLKDVRSVIYINGIEIAQGDAEKIERDRITLSIKIDNERLRDMWVSHLRSNQQSQIVLKIYPKQEFFGIEIGSPIEFKKQLDTDIFNINFSDVELSIAGKTVFALRDIKLRQEKVSSLETTLIMSGIAINNVPAEIKIRKIEYEITVNNVSAGKGTETLNLVLKPFEREIFESAVNLDNRAIPRWWAEHVKKGERSEITLKAMLYVETVGMEVKVKIQNSKEFTTDVVGELTLSQN